MGDVVDPADADLGLSGQSAAAEGTCPGPVVFPMAEDQAARDWASVFEYPDPDSTGDISLESLIEELDDEGRFMIDVYDEIVAQKGGEGSDEAAAFLTEFMPLQNREYDRRNEFFRLQFLSQSPTDDRIPFDTPENPNILYSVQLDPEFGGYVVYVARTLHRYWESGQADRTEIRIDPAEAAKQIIAAVEDGYRRNLIAGWLFVGVQVMTIPLGVGAFTGAATLAGRLAITTALVFDAFDIGEQATGYLGYNRGDGYNPIREAFRYVGRSTGGEQGQQTAELVFNTLNIMIGFGGKLGVVAGGLYASQGYQPSCLPADGDLTEQPLESVPN